MSTTYHNLSSSNEPDIFDINKYKKHLLNGFIHLAKCMWEAQKHWYAQRVHTSSNLKVKNFFISTFYPGKLEFSELQLWLCQFYPQKYQVQNRLLAPSPKEKLITTRHFLKHCVNNIGFVYYWPLFCFLAFLQPAAINFEPPVIDHYL